MKSFEPKFKIYNKTQQNLHDIVLTKQFKKKKWTFFIKKYEKKGEKKKYSSVNPKKIFSDEKKLLRPESLKYLYKTKLSAGQKFKSFYGFLSHKKLKQYFISIQKKNSFNLIDQLITTLEKRLDIALYRSHLFPSIFQIQQKIKHKHIKVNGVYVNSSQYILKPGDVISIKPEIQTYNCKDRIIPSYFEWNKKLNTLIFLREPAISEIQYPFNMDKNLILEYLYKQ